MADDMARPGTHGEGGYDESTKTWKLRCKAKGIFVSASNAKLRKVFGIDIGDDEAKMRPYWRKYRDAAVAAITINTREQRLADAKKRFADQPIASEYSEFEKCPTTGEVRFRVPMSMDEVRLTNIINQIQNPATSADIRDWCREQLAPQMGRVIPKGESLAAEIATEVAREKAKGTRSHYDVKKYLEFFAASINNGNDTRLADINVHHFRAFFVALKASSWGERSQFNCQKIVKNFLKRTQGNFDLTFTFVGSPEFRWTEPEGKKEKWTLEQVKLALKEATGVDRAILLLGLNAGAYNGDIRHYTLANVVNGRIEAKRAKLRHEKYAMTGAWKLWAETAELLPLVIGMTEKQIEAAFREFRTLHGLPNHKNLRKTVAQWIEERCTTEQARMYRCEKVEGTHGRSYISFTEEMKQKVDAALDVVGKMLGLA